MELSLGVKLPPHSRILQGYMHFEALTDHQYIYSCVKCGSNPAIVVMDLHKKGVFSLPGEENVLKLILSVTDFFFIYIS